MSDRRSVAGLAFRGRKVLLMQRLPGGDVGSLWEFPGGKVELEESPQEALIREWVEETGWAIQVGELLAHGRFLHTGKAFDLLAYRVYTPDGDPALIEHADFRWVELEHIDQAGMVPSDIIILRELLNMSV